MDEKLKSFLLFLIILLEGEALKSLLLIFNQFDDEILTSDISAVRLAK